MSPPPTATGHTSGNVLLKQSGAVEEQRFEHGAAGGVFAPVSLSATEDEGGVMAYAHDLVRGKTDLMILAAQGFAGESVARIHLPLRVPLGLHGSGFILASLTGFRTIKKPPSNSQPTGLWFPRH